MICAHIVDYFWWPNLSANIAWFVKTCHLCQLHQTCNILILLVVATSVPLFMKMYMDMMHLPKSSGFKYLVQGCCSLTHYPEYHVLHTETTKTIGNWIFDDILCRWGTISEIIALPLSSCSIIWGRATIFATYESTGITLMQMALWKECILMFTKHYSRHATAINPNGIQ